MNIEDPKTFSKNCNMCFHYLIFLKVFLGILYSTFVKSFMYACTYYYNTIFSIINFLCWLVNNESKNIFREYPFFLKQNTKEVGLGLNMVFAFYCCCLVFQIVLFYRFKFVIFKRWWWFSCFVFSSSSSPYPSPWWSLLCSSFIKCANGIRFIFKVILCQPPL